MVQQKLLLSCFLILIFSMVPATSHSIFVNTGDNLRVDFDLSAETPSGPYEGVYATLLFGSSNKFDIGEVYTVDVFDDDGTLLADGIGYLIIHDITGPFELTNVTVAGRFYDGNAVTDTTGYLSGSMSSLLNLPDLSASIGTHIVSASFDNTSSVGVDVVFPQSSVVPEPVSSTLFIVGGATLGFRRFRKKIKQ